MKKGNGVLTYLSTKGRTNNTIRRTADKSRDNKRTVETVLVN